MTPEGKIKAEIKAILAAHDVYYFMPQPGFTCRAGVADVSACVGGWYVAIEAKAGNKGPTALQNRELEKVIAAGGFSICVNAINLHNLKYFIESLSNGRADRFTGAGIWALNSDMQGEE